MLKRLFPVLLLAWLLPCPGHASVFTIPQFVEYHSWAVGLEPEAILDSSSEGSGSGVGLNAKFTYGLTPISNLQVSIGPGSGSKEFRFGGAYSFDFIPDLSGQIGAGLAIQGVYFSTQSSNSKYEFSTYPYLHKRFDTAGGLVFDPYVALPMGLSFFQSKTQTFLQGAAGTYFQTSEHVGLNGEIGFSLKNADSYLAFGVSYRD